jgi:glycosyltransferase involved in cell wall biosynthesis
LREQLESFLVQTHRRWVLFWRDDGSTDGTAELVRDFAAHFASERTVEVGPPSRRGPTESYLTLLRAAVSAYGYDAFAFADQDDVWLPVKLARGLTALGRVAKSMPAMYCARQVVVGEDLQRLGVSSRFKSTPVFPAALAQNIATGCTIMLNLPAARLIARSQPASASYHDWWCYLLVTAAGGEVLTDNEPTVLYRQHGGNLVGAPASIGRRAISAIRRGPSVFMHVFRQQVMALAGQQELLAWDAPEQVATLAEALRGDFFARLRALARTPGLRRQTWPETALFRLWFLLG